MAQVGKPQDISFKKIIESDQYEFANARLKREINEHRLTIDYKVFEKTDEERALLATLKMQWKEIQKFNKTV